MKILGLLLCLDLLATCAWLTPTLVRDRARRDR